MSADRDSFTDAAADLTAPTPESLAQAELIRENERLRRMSAVLPVGAVPEEMTADGGHYFVRQSSPGCAICGSEDKSAHPRFRPFGSRPDPQGHPCEDFDCPDHALTPELWDQGVRPGHVHP